MHTGHFGHRGHFGHYRHRGHPSYCYNCQYDGHFGHRGHLSTWSLWILSWHCGTGTVSMVVFVGTVIIVGTVVIWAPWQGSVDIAGTVLLTSWLCPEMHAMAYLAKMAEMAINRRIINKNSNEMAKGPFRKVAILAKMAYLTETAINRQRHSSKGHFCHLIWIASPLAIFRHPNLPFCPKSPISPKSPLSKGPLLASNLNRQPSGEFLPFSPLHAFLDTSVSARSNLGSVSRKSLNNNDRDQVLWGRDTECPTQTLVFTKSAGRQPGWGHCYLRSSQSPALGFSMRPRSFPPGVPRAHRDTRGWRLSKARTIAISFYFKHKIKIASL